MPHFLSGVVSGTGANTWGPVRNVTPSAPACAPGRAPPPARVWGFCGGLPHVSGQRSLVGCATQDSGATGQELAAGVDGPPQRAFSGSPGAPGTKPVPGLDLLRQMGGSVMEQGCCVPCVPPRLCSPPPNPSPNPGTILEAGSRQT